MEEKKPFGDQTTAFNLFEEIKDEKPIPTDQEILKTIGSLGRKQAALEESAKEADVQKLLKFIRESGMSVPTVTEALKCRQEDLNQVRMRELPDIMKEAGLANFTLENGTKIEVKKDINVTVPDKPAFYTWMIQNGHEALIKNKVVVQFPKDGRASAQRFMKYLDRYYAKKGSCVFENQEDIHSQTLKSFVKTHLESGGNLPSDLIKIFEFAFAKIK